ncbi:MAG: T9SS type A sorting domain-containing protein [Bacteroidetes bacterium]|nr:T9SS type A sorting domain-containing protein [Bacteroidota bacterium]
MYPNPANNSVTLVYELPKGSPAELLLFNSTGMLQSKQLLNTEMTQMIFSTEHLAPGVYHYRINYTMNFS